jgi:hypothetical protein
MKNMTTFLLNTLERHGDGLAVFTNPAKRRKVIQSNLVTTVVLLFFTAYAWLERSPFLIAFNAVLCVLALPLTLFALFIEWRAKSYDAAIEVTPDGLRFFLAGSEPIIVRGEDVRELVLMPSAFGQTLMVGLNDERAFRARQSAINRLYMIMSNLYCGHGIGLTPNLSPEDFRVFTQELDRTFPNRVAVRQKAHQPPLLAKMLGNAKPHEAPLPVHVPPPLG